MRIPAEVIKAVHGEKPLTFKELQQCIEQNKLWGREETGTVSTGEVCFMSNGVKCAYFSHAIALETLQNATESFCNGNYGLFYDWNDKPTPGAEYGQYESEYGDTPGTGALMVHREGGAVVVYFQFER